MLVKGWNGKVGWFTELELLATYSLHIIKKDDSIGIHQKMAITRSQSYTSNYNDSQSSLFGKYNYSVN